MGDPEKKPMKSPETSSSTSRELARPATTELTDTQRAQQLERAFRVVEALDPETEWLANISNDGTRRYYRTSVAQFLAFWGMQSADELRRTKLSHVIAWRDALLADGKSASTVKSRVSAVSDLFKHLVMAGVVEHNPVRDLKHKKLRRPVGVTPALSQVQARAVLDAPPTDTVQGLRDRAILSVGFHEGPRRAEITKLRVRDWGENEGYASLLFRRKGGEESWVAVHAETKKRITEYLAESGHGENPDAPLFMPLKTSKPGLSDVRHMDGRQVTRVFQKWQREAELGLERASHSMRKTAATTAKRNGARIDDVQYMLGHADPRTTQLYFAEGGAPENSAALQTHYPVVEEEEPE